MRIMMLGGGTNQLCAIKRIKDRGDEVVVSDYLQSSPGKDLASYKALADTFSYEETLREAKAFNVDAVLTVGTDQPVLTAAKVSQTLGLPSGVSPQTALAVTNKKYMKKIFCEHKIPSVAYTLIEGLEGVNRLEDFTYPAVLNALASKTFKSASHPVFTAVVISVCSVATS